MQKSAISRTFTPAIRAVSGSASQTTSQTAIRSSSWSSNKPLMRMRIRVNCSGIVQASELSSIQNSRKLLHTKAYSPSQPLEQHSSSSPAAFFAPEVHSYQGDIFMAGSNSSYESLNVERRSRQTDDYHVGKVFGPADTTFSKVHEE